MVILSVWVCRHPLSWSGLVCGLFFIHTNNTWQHCGYFSSSFIFPRTVQEPGFPLVSHIFHWRLWEHLTVVKNTHYGSQYTLHFIWRVQENPAHQIVWGSVIVPTLSPMHLKITSVWRVNIKNIQTCREFSWVYLSQNDDNCQEATPEQIEKCSRERQFSTLLYIRIKGGATRRLCEVHWLLNRLRKKEKAKWEKLWD